MNQLLFQEHERLLAFYLSNLEYACGGHLGDLSALQWDHNERLPQFSAPSCFLPQGFGPILKLLARDLDVQLDQPVCLWS
jgi:lysine-specific histone demethylase 1B